MMKKYFILSSFILLLILISISIPTKESTNKEISFTQEELFLEENKEYLMPIEFIGLDIENIIFTLSNGNIVSIEGLKINALEAGHTVITATLDDDMLSTTTIDVYVINTPTLISSRNEIKVNETMEIQFNNPEAVGATREDFIWTVSNKSIADINDKYILTGLKNGTVTITATLKSDPTISSMLEFTIYTPTINYANRLVSIALAEEGYVEGYNKDTKYGTWYGLPNQDWCAMFISWSAQQANISTNVIPRFASVSAGKAFYEQRGLFRYKGSYTPKKGDIIFFLNGMSHAAIVTKVENGRVYTIEGNSANKVAQRNYVLNNSTITGYGTPNY